MVLAEWQRELIRKLFGWKGLDGRRRFRVLWLDVPSGSGKTTLAAALALYMLVVDPQARARIVLSGRNGRAAAELFAVVAAMIRLDCDLVAVCRQTKRTIRYKDNSITWVPPRSVRGEAENATCIVLDDVVSIKPEELFPDVAGGHHDHSKCLYLFLAGAAAAGDEEAWALHRYARRNLDHEIVDDGWLVHMTGALPSERWDDPIVWERVHPGWETLIPRSRFMTEYHQAKELPCGITQFKRKMLNIWSEYGEPWIDINRWDECVADIRREELFGRSCYGGLDLSVTDDLTAFILVFPRANGHYNIISFAFCSGQNIKERSRRDGASYLEWRDEGQLCVTDGRCLDYNVVRDFILELSEIFQIQEIAYDRWNASLLIQQLCASGLRCVPISQNASFLDRPARALENAVYGGRISHDGNPILRWCMKNIVMETNRFGELRPAKQRAGDRIDLVVATLFAISRALDASVETMDGVTEHCYV